MGKKRTISSGMEFDTVVIYSQLRTDHIEENNNTQNAASRAYAVSIQYTPSRGNERTPAHALLFFE